MRVPVLDGVVEAGFEGGLEFEVLCCLLYRSAPVLTKAHQPGGVAQDFFRAITLRKVTSSCTQLLLRIGRRVRISLPAAARIATTATVVGSMKYWNLAKV